MITIYHNPRCKKSRAGLQYLEDKGVDFEIRQYLKKPLSKDELKSLLTKMNKKPHDIIRTQEEKYRKELKGKNFSDEEWISILVENPKLMQRPIVEKEYKAVLAQPPENIDELL
ncbi:MAG: arsenate reductase (glutaredoxin) [Bacteroidales bacterium]|nr:arsenate reductase (glutaredoxin) [Bacteroidales bacterium]MCF8386733.1 arsenate reductase (glutaredoxin) [Bacteroidales bacterium]MCF8397255.1 arsenate reductase (glutaredoxin) [Bacteroidales bacterium]